MSTKNLLKLHEAIAVVLIGKKNRIGSFDEVAREINRRKIYVRKDGEDVPAYQVMQRCVLNNGVYRHLFESVEKYSVKLKNL